MTISRARLLLFVIALWPGNVSPSLTLRQAAAHRELLVGAAVRPSLFSEAAYSETLGREFNMMEAEDAMKWWSVRREQSKFDFREGDEVVRFAKAHGMEVRGHCLVWDHNNPEWLTQGRFTAEQMSGILHEHIAMMMKHYTGRVFAWDVVNEALDENGQLKDSPWYNKPGIGLADKGTAYIEQAFRWAREADPQALLFYNEADGEGLGRKADAIYAMVKDFKQRGVPIDGVGLQTHISNLDFDSGPVAANIARLTALGLQVHITELDVSLPLEAAGTGHTNDLLRQAKIYRGIVQACLQNPGCTAIQTWGFTDKYSWIGSHSHGERGEALLFDRAYKPKPAYAAMLEEIAASRSRTLKLPAVAIAPYTRDTASIIATAPVRWNLTPGRRNSYGDGAPHPAEQRFSSQAGHYSAGDFCFSAGSHSGFTNGF